MVTGQINAKNGQIYFPFIYALFIFILVNNLIGMVKRSLCILLFNFSNIIERFKFHNKLAFQLQSYSSSLNSELELNSQIVISNNSPMYSFNNNNTFYLNPDYITGFVDGEGCFSISIFKESKNITG